MAGGASHLIPAVSTQNAADMGGLIQVAFQAVLVSQHGRYFEGIKDVTRGNRFNMFAAGTVAGLARSCLPATLFIGFQYVM